MSHVAFGKRKTPWQVKTCTLCTHLWKIYKVFHGLGVEVL